MPSISEPPHNLDFDEPDTSLKAYFIDLMQHIDRYISVNETAIPLGKRRPDLFTIPLDDNIIYNPAFTLDIVIEIIEYQLGSLDLACMKFPFNFPYNKPSARIRGYLNTAKTSQQEIRKKLSGPVEPDSNIVSLEELALSPFQWSLYSNEIPRTALGAFYGLTKNDRETQTYLADPQNLMQQMDFQGYSPLRNLIFQDLSDAEIADNDTPLKHFYINLPDPSIGPISRSNDGRRITNLTCSRLEHINRFVRLAGALDWQYSDLDWALKCIANIENNGIPVINNCVLPYLAWIHNMQATTLFPIDQCCALIGTLKDYGERSSRKPSLFKRTFQSSNLPNVPKNLTEQTWYLPNIDQTSSTDQLENYEQFLSYLSAALQLSYSDLLKISYLIAEKSMKAGEQSGFELKLTKTNLAILYRLSLIPAITNLSLDEVFQATKLTGQESNLYAAPSHDVMMAISSLKTLSDWSKTSQISICQLQSIMIGPSDNSTIKPITYLAETLELSAFQAYYFETHYSDTHIFPIKLETIETLQKFRARVRSLDDTQDNLLDILNIDACRILDADAKLLKLTGWETVQLDFLKTHAPYQSPTGMAYGIDNVDWMISVMEIAGQLGVDLATLWQLISPKTETNEASIADALWTGLRKQYSEDMLTQTHLKLSEELRNHLVPLMIKNLMGEFSGITTASDLFEYLLVDVATTGARKNLRIKQAITSVQLYIARCFMRLEPGVHIDDEFTQIWSWMQHYHLWKKHRAADSA